MPAFAGMTAYLLFMQQRLRALQQVRGGAGQAFQRRWGVKL
jgi:hypothetical protein